MCAYLILSKEERKKGVEDRNEENESKKQRREANHEFVMLI
jgi:hypothetical protein